MLPLERPLLIFDGECYFCRQIADVWSRDSGNRVDFRPFQEVGDQFPEISHARFDASVQLIFPGGSIVEGAEAVFRLEALVTGWGIGLWAYQKVPGFSTISEWGYRMVSRNRGLVSSGMRRLFGPDFRLARYPALWRWVLSLPGIIYLTGLLSVLIFLGWLIYSS